MASIPTVGSVVRGQVVRIESYGAFVQLEAVSDDTSDARNDNQKPWRGLLHISQITQQRLDRVEDALSLQDEVWVKIVDIEEQQQNPSSDGGGRSQQANLRIRLTMKDIPQDGSSATTAASITATKQIQQAWQVAARNMDVARDPMSGMDSVRNGASDISAKVINGYELLPLEDDQDDNDTKPTTPSTAQRNQAGTNTNTSGENPNKSSILPLGRGRGTTLPAWMTSQSIQPVSLKPAQTPNDKQFVHEDDDSRGRHEQKSRKRDSRDKLDRRHREHHRKRDKKHGDSRSNSRHGHRHASRNKRQDEDASDEDSHGHDRRRQHHKSKRRRDRKPSKKSRRRSSPTSSPIQGDNSSASSVSSYSSQNKSHSKKTRLEPKLKTRDRSASRDKAEEEGDMKFQNVEEARRLISEIESRRHERDV